MGDGLTDHVRGESLQALSYGGLVGEVKISHSLRLAALVGRPRRLSPHETRRSRFGAGGRDARRTAAGTAALLSETFPPYRPRCG
jgi:hypothetical protein